MDIGPRIRTFRTQQQLTLAELSSRTGISRAMLSEIERNSKSPTLRTLTQLAGGLGMTISQMLGEQPLSEIRIFRESELEKYRDPESRVEYQVLSPGWEDRGVGIMRFQIPTGHSTGRLAPHPPGTGEHLYVLSGQLDGTVGEATFQLGPGDAVTYTPDVPHEFRATGETDCSFVLTVDSRPPAGRQFSRREFNQ